VAELVYAPADSRVGFYRVNVVGSSPTGSVMSKYIYRKTFDWIIDMLKDSMAKDESYESRISLWEWFDRLQVVLYA